MIRKVLRSLSEVLRDSNQASRTFGTPCVSPSTVCWDNGQLVFTKGAYIAGQVNSSTLQVNSERRHW